MEIREMQEAAEELIFVGMTHRMGIFEDLYRQPDTSEGLASRRGYDLRVTWTLLEALVEMNYLEKKGDVYHVPADVIPRLIDRSSDGYEGDFWKFLLYLLNPWKTLPYVLKHGEPDISSYAELSLQDFIRGMNSPWKKFLAPEIVDHCLAKCKNAHTIADIGGAPGTIAREFASRGLRSIIFDLPDCVDVMSEELSGIKGLELVRGDATKTLPDGPWDIAFLGNICHGQSPEDNECIIRGCFERLNPDGIVVIFDNLRGEGYHSARLALHMITQSRAGDIYSREQYLDWVSGAGFKDAEVLPLTDHAWHLVIGRK